LILLDTHVVLWLTSDPAKLSGKARAAIEASRRNGDGLAVCDITLLELTTLASKGRIQLSLSLESILQEIEARFVVLPIRSRACARAMGSPPTFPKDPADRMIVATAIVEGLSLVTADREIRRSKLIPTIW
jgi:PIN domain nuclease of toxin-antitoxin system